MKRITIIVDSSAPSDTEYAAYRAKLSDPEQISLFRSLVWQGGKSGEATVLSAYCQSQLELANRDAIHSLDFPSLPSDFGWPPAQEASVILKTVMDFLAVHAFPEQVRILCTSELSAAVYCQTWNLWYAESKADCMSIP